MFHPEFRQAVPVRSDVDNDIIGYAWKIDGAVTETSINESALLALGSHLLTVAVYDNRGSVDATREGCVMK